MALKRMDNVGIVVDDLEGTIDFFRELGLEGVRLNKKNQDLSFIHWHTGEPLVSFQPSFSFTSK